MFFNITWIQLHVCVFMAIKENYQKINERCCIGNLPLVAQIGHKSDFTYLGISCFKYQVDNDLIYMRDKCVCLTFWDLPQLSKKALQNMLSLSHFKHYIYSSYQRM